MMKRKRDRFNIGSIFYFRWRDSATGRMRASGSTTRASTGRTAPQSGVPLLRQLHQGSCPRIERRLDGRLGTDPVLEPRGAA